MASQSNGGTDAAIAIQDLTIAYGSFVVMHDLTFTVTFSGVTPVSDPVIDLGMPGMSMGPNRVVLKRAGENTYQGAGVIVRCPSGRRTWKATVTVPDKRSAEFVFDVVY